MEDVGNQIPESTLIGVIEDHDDLTNHLRDGSNDDHIVSTPSITDNCSDFTEEDFRA